MFQTLIDAPRWLFVVLLFYAPWAYGCTVPWAIEFLDLLMASIVTLWFAGSLCRRRQPALHPVSLGLISALILLGWAVTLNPHFQYEPDSHAFIPLPHAWKWIPGTVNKPASVLMMIRITGLLGLLAFVSDLATRPVWRLLLARAVAFAGISVILLGLIQRLSGAPGIFWQKGSPQSLFFAAYNYQGNAGAFLNLVLPFIAANGLLAFRAPASHFQRIFWSVSLVLCLSASLLNVSRAALTVTSLLLVALLLCIWLGNLLPARTIRSRLPLFSAAAIVGVAGVIAACGWTGFFEKWKLLPSQLQWHNSRLLAWRACLRMLPDAGPWGFGPGAFESVFPHYTASLDEAIAGIWRYAHNDYLQAVLEWGWIGAALWAALFFGGLIRCFARNSAPASPDDRIISLCAGLALAGAACHALIDFPLQIASLQLYAVTCLGIGWRLPAVQHLEGRFPRDI